MDSDFKVRSTAAEYDETDATGVFPASPWCIYTDKIRAARYGIFYALNFTYIILCNIQSNG